VPLLALPTPLRSLTGPRLDEWATPHPRRSAERPSRSARAPQNPWDLSGEHTRPLRSERCAAHSVRNRCRCASLGRAAGAARIRVVPRPCRTADGLCRRQRAPKRCAVASRSARSTPGAGSAMAKKMRRRSREPVMMLAQSAGGNKRRREAAMKIPVENNTGRTHTILILSPVPSTSIRAAAGPTRSRRRIDLPRSGG